MITFFQKCIQNELGTLMTIKHLNTYNFICQIKHNPF